MRRRTGPLARVNLFRFTVLAVILISAVLAFTLQAGVFKFVLRSALLVGIVLLFGSYVWQWWRKRARNRSGG